MDKNKNNKRDGSESAVSSILGVIAAVFILLGIGTICAMSWNNIDTTAKLLMLYSLGVVLSIVPNIFKIFKGNPTGICMTGCGLSTIYVTTLTAYSSWNVISLSLAIIILLAVVVSFLALVKLNKYSNLSIIEFQISLFVSSIIITDIVATDVGRLVVYIVTSLSMIGSLYLLKRINTVDSLKNISLLTSFLIITSNTYDRVPVMSDSLCIVDLLWAISVMAVISTLYVIINRTIINHSEKSPNSLGAFVIVQILAQVTVINIICEWGGYAQLYSQIGALVSIVIVACTIKSFMKNEIMYGIQIIISPFMMIVCTSGLESSGMSGYISSLILSIGLALISIISYKIYGRIRFTTTHKHFQFISTCVAWLIAFISVIISFFNLRLSNSSSTYNLFTYSSILDYKYEYAIIIFANFVLLILLSSILCAECKFVVNHIKNGYNGMRKSVSLMEISLLFVVFSLIIPSNCLLDLFFSFSIIDLDSASFLSGVFNDINLIFVALTVLLSHMYISKIDHKYRETSDLILKYIYKFFMISLFIICVCVTNYSLTTILICLLVICDAVSEVYSNIKLNTYNNRILFILMDFIYLSYATYLINFNTINTIANIIFSLLLISICTKFMCDGFTKNLKEVRITSLWFNVLAIIKIAVYDASSEDAIFRVVAFLVSGTVCFILSALYSNFYKKSSLNISIENNETLEGDVD